ncbi:hypothetical protein PV416_04995 [Streptomyces ipomoeae]|jgi:hypothetical protein|uniref:hypothetical protein n=1 Tax=Streptomyces ipomoeae TaxID=103232 RepID=UPI0029BB3102|nr:hypothetical protein [Streptomyces ipomoeae]MDX2820458.1 hypothetical protein [Streptomyces ipomoeae]MDX2877328.1 hypothetical protein [Streptomyces ipomoeae]
MPKIATELALESHDSVSEATVNKLAEAIQWTGSGIAGAITFHGMLTTDSPLEASAGSGLIVFIGLPVLAKGAAKVRSVIKEAFTI